MPRSVSVRSEGRHREVPSREGNQGPGPMPGALGWPGLIHALFVAHLTLRPGSRRPARRASRGAGRAASSSRVSPMTKWEYVTVPLLVHATKQILDNWGQDGWELVQVVPGPNPEQLVAYLKREKA
ncbi:hypothetical protein GCM10010495_14390 [Kitasatospora herbaricolor]|nr:hypothetical protein GCM10010495_14390 [Kitasatospora herbaricolor]